MERYKNIFPLHNLVLLDLNFKLYLSDVTQGSLFYCFIPPLDPDHSVVIQSATLPGFLDGIMFYRTSQWSKLTEASVWGDTAMQIFFPLSSY